MYSSQINTETSSTIEAEMSALKQHVLDYRSAINQEGIWLFLTTLGCWGIPNHFFQLIAFILAVFLFGERASSRLKEKKSSPKLVKELEERIELSPHASDYRKARLYDLNKFKTDELSALNNLKSVKIFAFCWLFYGASLIYTMLSTKFLS